MANLERRQDLFPHGAYMSVEQWIYRTDPFRYSTLESPFPLPVVEKLIDPLARDLPDPESKRYTRAGIDLIHIFKKCGIKPSTGSYIVRVRSIDKPGYDAPMDENPLLHMKTDVNTSKKVFLVDINAAKTHPSIWKRAADEFRKYLMEQGMQNYHVEMRDPNRAFQPSLFPLRSSHPDIEAWEVVRDRVAIFLDKRLPSQWGNICLWNVKDSVHADTVVTVVVHVDVRLEADWLQLRGMLRGYLPAEKRWDIIFLPGGVSRSPAKLDNGRSFVGAIKELPPTGTGIGRGGGVGVATLGGYVCLKQGPRVYHCIMTTHSAVRLHRYEAGEEVRMNTDRYGYTFFNLSGSHWPDWNKPSFQFPAQIDCEATKENCRDTLNMAQKELDDYQRQLMPSPWSQVTHSAINELNRLEQEMMMAQKMAGVAENLPMDLGRVLVSSGRHIGPKFSTERRHKPFDKVHWEFTSNEAAYLDWALIELPNWNPKWSGARTRAPLEKELKDQLPKNYEISRVYGCYFPTQQAYEFTAIEKNAWYCKRGRSTDATAGMCHGTALYTNRHGSTSESTSVYDETDEEMSHSRNKHYKESVIVNWQSEQLVTQRSFCAPGDEGAFVFDIEGQVAGMLVGALTSRCGPPPKGQKPTGSEGTMEEGELYVSAGIVTSMHHILPSVKLHTVDDRVEDEGEKGGALSLP